MDREEIRYLLGGTIYAQARSDLAKDAIKEFSSESGAEGVRHLEAVVQGGASRYHVQVWLRANGSFVSASCDCPYNNRGEGDLCKHIGAVLLQDAQRENQGRTLTEEPASPAAPIAGVMRGSEYAAQHAARKDSYTSSLEMLFGRKWRDMEPESDNAAWLLLKEYMDQDAVLLEEPVLEPEYKGTVSLEPELTLARNSLPEIRLRISGAGGNTSSRASRPCWKLSKKGRLFLMDSSFLSSTGPRPSTTRPGHCWLCSAARWPLSGI